MAESAEESRVRGDMGTDTAAVREGVGLGERRRAMGGTGTWRGLEELEGLEEAIGAVTN